MTPRGRGGGSNSVDTDAGNRKTGPFQASSWVATGSQKPVFAAYDEPGTVSAKSIIQLSRVRRGQAARFATAAARRKTD